MTKWLCGIAAAAMAMAGGGLRGSAADLVYTVGTVAKNASGQDWAYVTWGRLEQGGLGGKRFAIYSRPGDANAAGTFTRRGVAEPLVLSGAVDAALNRSLNLGVNLNGLSNAVFSLFPEIASRVTTTAGRLAQAIQSTATNETSALRLGALSRMYPGVQMSLGLGWAESIAAAGATTFEVREIDSVTGNETPLIGRVTVIAGDFQLLPAPDRPVQVVEDGPKGDLNIRLRWGESVELRRLALMAQGYNLWRLPRAQAEAKGWHVTAPSGADLFRESNLVQVNEAPVFRARDYALGTGGGSAYDFASDPTTWFFADDNQRFENATPFQDGQEFLYFATSRDLLGRDGPPSVGGRGIACRRMPPRAPMRLTVENDFNAARPAADQQLLRVSWVPGSNGPLDRVNFFAVYRWTNMAQVHTNELRPLNQLVAIVPATGGVVRASYLDGGPTSPHIATAADRTFWYTVRAVNSNQCGLLFSPNSPPAFGVLRQRKGPDAPEGDLVTACAIPSVVFSNRVAVAEPDLDATRHHLRLVCVRRDPEVAWAEFTVSNRLDGAFSLGRVEFGPEDQEVFLDYSYLRVQDQFFAEATCIVGSSSGLVSAPAVARVADPTQVGTRLELQFFAGTIGTTSLTSSDPLTLPFLSGPIPAFSVEGLANHMVRLGFDYGAGTIFVQHRAKGRGQDAEWLDVGVGVLTLFHTVMLDASVEDCSQYDYRAWRVRLPAPGECDHAARTGDQINPVCITIKLKPGTREARIYRCLDDGPKTLIRAIPARYVEGSPANVVTICDDAMPPVNASACYYAQLFDDNGNASALVLLHAPIWLRATLPTPVLAPVEASGSETSPTATLRWFCPPAGVERFWITMTPTGRVANASPGGPSAFRILPELRRAAHYQPSFQSLKIGMSKAFVFVSEKVETGRVGGDFQPGPNFSLTTPVEAGVSYLVSIQAVWGTNAGPHSAPPHAFTWKPAPPLAQVPWPAKSWQLLERFDEWPDIYNGIPGVPLHEEPRVRAQLLQYYRLVTNANQQVSSEYVVDAKYPVGIAVAELPRNLDPQPTVGTDLLVTDPSNFGGLPRDIAVMPFKRLSKNKGIEGEPLFPIVIYRQQVANTNFTKVSADLVQITPLLEKLPWTTQVGQRLPPVIADPLFALATVNDFYVDRSLRRIMVRDSQPLIRGAAYRYYVVRFKPNHEIAQIIDAGVVTIPQ